jgi:hypothetical protein
VEISRELFHAKDWQTAQFCAAPKSLPIAAEKTTNQEQGGRFLQGGACK